MTTAHLGLSALTAYVDGELVGLDAWELERHVASCRLCANALQQAAQLEVAMHQVATRDDGVRTRRSWHQRLAPLFAAAAAMVCWAGFAADGVAPTIAPSPESTAELSGALCAMPDADDASGGVCRDEQPSGALCSVAQPTKSPPLMCSTSERLYTPLDPGAG